MAKKVRNAKEKALAKEIKEMEVTKKAAKAAQAPKPQSPVPDERISFDQWWMTLVRKIDMRPAYKEVIKADFRSRGLGDKAMHTEYDKALELYGIKL